MIKVIDFSGHIFLERQRLLRLDHLDRVDDVLKGAAPRSHADRVTLCDAAQRPEKCIAMAQHHDIPGFAGKRARGQMSGRLAKTCRVDTLAHHHIQMDARYLEPAK